MASRVTTLASSRPGRAGIRAIVTAVTFLRITSINPLAGFNFAIASWMSTLFMSHRFSPLFSETSDLYELGPLTRASISHAYASRVSLHRRFFRLLAQSELHWP